MAAGRSPNSTVPVLHRLKDESLDWGYERVANMSRRVPVAQSMLVAVP
jgi:hypothetical protein